ncbi:MAG: HlyD family secretion protein [Limisphaerales bacterium]
METIEPSPRNPEETPGLRTPSVSLTERRRMPGRWGSVRLLAGADLDAIASSWLSRGFLLASGLLTVLALKGMQAEQKPASQMLEAVYVGYLLIWMHGVIFIAGGAFTREQECLNDAILSRGLTRGEYVGGKLVARCLAMLLMIGGVLLPASLWAIRQDQLIRAEAGQVVSKARNTKVAAWDPQKVFAGTEGTVTELKVETGDAVRAGEILVILDDRQLFDHLETERRAEETARNEVANAQRRFEDAQRGVAQVEDALARAERSLMAKDMLSRFEQADRETEIRARKRDLQTAENQLRVSQDAITTASRAVENVQARVREARKRLGQATLTAPLSGYATEVLVQAAQYVPMGAHLLTIARLDDYEVRVPIYDFEEFKRLKAGLTAYVTVGKTEFSGVIDRLGATAQPDRWGQTSNFAIVRFKGDGTLGLLGLDADVRIVLPAVEEKPNRVTAMLKTLTGQGVDDVGTRSTSVTTVWMLVGLGKVLGCACLLVTLTLLLLVVTRSALMAILGAIGLWHVSNLFFDFAGLPGLSYLEMVRTMDKVLGGVATMGEELTVLAWLYGIAAALGVAAIGLFISRDPPK